MKKMLISCVAVLSVFILVGCGTQSTNNGNSGNTDTTSSNNGTAGERNPEMDALASCMTEAGLTMYGTEWCIHCQDQKALFGKSFDKVTFVDCDASKPACVAAGVQGFPTWKDAAGNAYPGTQSLEKLATLAGCTK